MTRCSTISRIPNPTQNPDTGCGPGKKTRYVIVKLERPTTNKQRKKEEEEIDISVYRMPSTNWLTREFRTRDLESERERERGERAKDR